MSPFNIEEDNQDVRDAVYAAKYGNWKKVYDILNKKKYLVNCIPEERSWAMLHQAVYWNNEDAVSFILNLETCDSLIKSKRCRDGLVPPNSTAIDVAEKMGGRDGVKYLIKQNISNERKKRFSQHISYKVSRKDGEKLFNHFPLFIREIAMYKNTLVGKGKHVKEHLIDILKQIFQNEEYHFDRVEQELHQSLYGYDKASADEIKKVDSEDKYFAELIRLYTGNWVYKAVNEAMAKCLKPDAKDLALGLYAMLLDVTITFWPTLEQTSGETYRGVENQMGDYNKDEEIMFTSIISSSGSREIAEGFAGSSGTLFIIDNSANATTRPKHVRKYAVPEHKYEDEYVYAIGTEFRVTNNYMKGSLRVINLKLLGTCELGKKP